MSLSSHSARAAAAAELDLRLANGFDHSLQVSVKVQGPLVQIAGGNGDQVLVAGHGTSEQRFLKNKILCVCV
jgi:hypothetical protein